MDYKREVFFLKILCHIFDSEMSMLPLKLTKQALEMFPQKFFLRTALSVHFLEIELLEQHFTMGLQKGDFLFLIIYKDQQAANTFFFGLF